MKCPQCDTDNRPLARYCRQCAAPLAASAVAASVPDASGAPDAFSGLIGMEALVEPVRTQIARARTLAVRMVGRRAIRIPFDMLICGPTGTGKTAFAEALARALKEAGLIGSDSPVVVDASQWGGDIASKALADSADAVLVIDRVNRLLPRDKEDYARTVVLEDLAERIRDDAADAKVRRVVVFTGDDEFADYSERHAIYRDAFVFRFRTEVPSLDVVARICADTLRRDYGAELTPDGAERLKGVLARMKRDATTAFGNGHTAVKKAGEIIRLAAADAAPDADAIPVAAGHVPGQVFVPKSLDDVMADFDRFVGMDSMKAEVARIAARVALARSAGTPEAELLGSHYLFLGNPGTGKTTMARLFADALAAMGVLPAGHLVEASRSDLVGAYSGHTAPLVRAAFDRAEGGVLFVDEAYALKNGEGDTFGQEAINELIKLAEDRMGRLVVILAGYTKEMGELERTNSGIPSRFGNRVNFRDYTAEELEEIFRRMVAQKGYALAPDADAGIPAFFRTMYEKRQPDFGNAREVRNTLEKAIGNLADRLTRLAPGEAADPMRRAITMADIEGAYARPRSVEEIMASFDDLVGMADVKEQVRRIANRVNFDRLRMESGRGDSSLVNIHIAITGNPGTGKTTVARRLGEVFKAMGVLPSDRIVERQRKTLITSFVGSGPNNMNKAVDEAMGGILFIDEAYNLYQPSGPDGDKYGLETVEALMTRLSDDAGKFIAVIAGYDEPIDWFLDNANPGLRRRFSHRIRIPDYTAPQLAEIFRRAARAKGFELTPEAEACMEVRMELAVARKTENFGNAGEAMSILSQAIERQSERLAREFTGERPDESTLFTLEADDIPGIDPAASSLNHSSDNG